MRQADLPDRATIYALIDAKGELALRIVPGARVERACIENGMLKLWTRTPPEHGKATKAVIEMLAKLLDLPPAHITLVSGATSRAKRVRIA